MAEKGKFDMILCINEFNEPYEVPDLNADIIDAVSDGVLSVFRFDTEAEGYEEYSECTIEGSWIKVPTQLC
ncbi:hypothetical protein LCGC14_0454920 [marine sediment metagenome]|uniref:Uncharacterized protein n=1 Tax=marine sediment metagenome TaxID=412755 RepID=A0A0F9VQH2_9ZZZZ